MSHGDLRDVCGWFLHSFEFSCESDNQSDSVAQIPVMDVMGMESHVSFTRGRGEGGVGEGAGEMFMRRKIYC